MVDKNEAPGSPARGATMTPNDRDALHEARKLVSEISALRVDSKGQVSIDKAQVLRRLRKLNETLNDPKFAALLVE